MCLPPFAAPTANRSSGLLIRFCCSQSDVSSIFPCPTIWEQEMGNRANVMRAMRQRGPSFCIYIFLFGQAVLHNATQALAPYWFAQSSQSWPPTSLSSFMSAIAIPSNRFALSRLYLTWFTQPFFRRSKNEIEFFLIRSDRSTLFWIGFLLFFVSIQVSF